MSRGAHAVVILDRAGWHGSGKLVTPANITLLHLPPRAPELNPVENLWQFLRDNWLSNKIFRSYDQILALCCEAWNKLIEQPWTIMSIGTRDWAHGFRSMRIGSLHEVAASRFLFALAPVFADSGSWFSSASALPGSVAGLRQYPGHSAMNLWEVLCIKRRVAATKL